MRPLPPEDILSIVDQVNWDPLRSSRILLTGGTGLIGRWLVESFSLANANLKLGASMLVVSRKGNFGGDEGGVSYAIADILYGGGLRGRGGFTHCIHAACPSCACPPIDDITMFRTIVRGTDNVLGACEDSGVCRALYVSSGAARLKTETPYGAAKLAAESLCKIYSNNGKMGIPIARPYTLIGPGLPLDAHFAVGNFIGDAIRGGPIVIKGNKNAIRSYLYMSDATVLLWRSLVSGKTCIPIEIGSHDIISIVDLAKLVGETLGSSVCSVSTAMSCDYDYYGVPDRPSANKRGLECDWLSSMVSLDDAILKTAEYYGYVR